MYLRIDAEIRRSIAILYYFCSYKMNKNDSFVLINGFIYFGSEFIKNNSGFILLIILLHLIINGKK
jgi:hypothetical protein